MPPAPSLPTERLGVVGWPVSHSRSPAMQNAALVATGLNGWRYSALPVRPEMFAELISALPARGFRGVNVTVPHKESALALATDSSPAAAAIGAANTLLFSGAGDVRAENTDAPALIASLPFPAAGCTALVLGAGGSARATVWALKDAGAREVMIWNRSAERAERLGDQLGATVIDRARASVMSGDLLVNCTTLGLKDELDQFKGLPLEADALLEYRCVVDFVYRRNDTPLISAARTRGVVAVDGLELLVRQGGLSFSMFTGQPAPLEVMSSAARGVSRAGETALPGDGSPR